jgi:hypothetical protein
MSIRPKIEAALSGTADRISPGSGADVVRQAKNDLQVIDASSENLNSRYANEDVRIATTAIFETKHFDGDPVTIETRQEGLIVVFSNSFVCVRPIAFGARDVKVVVSDQVSVEKVTAMLDGEAVPGLRITGGFGMPKFALAVALPEGPGNPAAQAAIRDEIYDLLA